MANKQQIQLHIIAEDYEKSINFSRCDACLISTAAKRQFNTNVVSENVDKIFIDHVYYKHKTFDYGKYEKAMLTRQPFTLILTPQ